MKVCILDKYHHKNQYFLEQLVSNNYERVSKIADADVVLSASTSVDVQKYPNKRFIFGPHFSVFPNKVIRNIKPVNGNAIYIQPSEPFRLTWLNEYQFNTMPIKSMAFGVNTHKFCEDSNSVRDLVILYHKNRAPNDLRRVIDFLKQRGIEYRVFDYKQRYREEDYLSALKRAKYAVWVGAHESQGFALQEALSCNVPLLVWTVSLHKQEWSSRNTYKNVKSVVSSIPYWDHRCGEFFHHENELDASFEKFIDKVNNGVYEPRKFILENLSIEVREKEWVKLINSFKN